VDGVLITGFFGVLGLVSWALFLFAAFAFVDAAIRREDAYRAADKNTKPFWLIILGIAAVVMKLFSVLSFLPVIGLVAVIVYMVDVRPEVRRVAGRGTRGPRRLGRRRSSSSDGPYGPFNGH
jgi:O-antigen ligase